MPDLIGRIRRRTLSRALGVLLVLAGCVRDGGPPCDVDPVAVDTAQANAGCLLLDGSRVLVVRERLRDRWNLPAGHRKWGESAQCTAVRETWEEAGLAATAGRLLHVFPHGFRLYACTTAEIPDSLATNDPDEVVEVAFHDLDDLDSLSWRFPGQIDLLRALARSSNP